MQELCEYQESKVFIAENIIKNYINKTPTVWDDWLSLATVEVVRRMDLDNGVKSESDLDHSVTYRDMKSISEFLWPSISALLDGYRDQPTRSGDGNFTII